ncbi:MAG TPA: LCP family protein [Beutenbergiaceae bacterium]|nr:LCP family protein [Beutenbergiaceae bacterium]
MSDSGDDLLGDFDQEEAPARARKRPRRKGRIVLGVLVVLVLAVVGLVAGYGLMLNNTMNQAESVSEAFPDDADRPATVEPDDGYEAPVNILLLGTDTRASGASLLTDLGSRADTIMLMHIPGDRESVQLMSFMRDLWVDIPGHGTAKINAALAYGGVPLMVQTMETIVDQRIDHVAIIDFEGFEGLTDELGGVTVDNGVAFSASNSDHHFEEGSITLDGEQALSYVRERYAFSDGDYQRVVNQRAYLAGLMDEMLSRDVLINPLKVNELASTMTPHMATTDTLGPRTVLNLGPSLVGLRSSDVNTFTVPTLGTGSEGGQSVVYPNWDGIEEIREALASGSMTDFEPAPAS